MKQIKKETTLLAVAFLCILAGALLNPWLLKPLTRLSDGYVSPLRVIVLLLFDGGAIAAGYYLIKHRKTEIGLSKKTIFCLFALLLALFFMESVLQMLTRLSPAISRQLSGTAITLHISDDHLGQRPNPNHPEHDARGFRNRTALTEADIVALGDSQTYGMGVKRHQAWPQQLNRISGHTVYSMSFGGYGCVEGLALLEEAARLNPKLVVFALFTGNDLVDAFNAVYNKNLFPEFKSADSVQAAIEQIEKTSPLMEQVRHITWRMWQKEWDESPAPNEKADVPVHRRTLFSTIKKAKLLQLFFAAERCIQNMVVHTPYRRWLAIKNGHVKHPEIFEVFEAPPFRTIFTPEYRYIAMNLDDPRIAEGLSISLKALQRMQAVAAANGIDFLVLLIPTKEMVFHGVLDNDGIEPSESMLWVLQQETRLHEQVRTFLKQHDIAFLEAIAALRQSLMDGKQPYFIDADGHLNAVGHDTVARSVNAYIQSSGLGMTSR